MWDRLVALHDAMTGESDGEADVTSGRCDSRVPPCVPQCLRRYAHSTQAGVLA
jgi:hypothetical protein